MERSTENRTQDNFEFNVEFYRREPRNNSPFDFPSVDVEISWTPISKTNRDYIKVYAKLDTERDPETPMKIKVVAQVLVSVSSSFVSHIDLPQLVAAMNLGQQIANDLKAEFDAKAVEAEAATNAEFERLDREREDRKTRIADSQPTTDEIGRKPKTYAEMDGRRLWHPSYGRGTVVATDSNAGFITVRWDEQHFNDPGVYNASKLYKDSREKATWVK